MQTQNLNFDVSSLIGATGAGQAKGRSGGDAFDQLLAQITMATAQSGQYAAAANPLGSTLSTSNAGSLASLSDKARAYQSPIQRLESSLNSTGRPLNDFRVPAEDREKLREVLVKSGYGEKDSDEILKRSSQDDGAINLGTMFNVLSEYQAKEGPVFAMAETDEPLLRQFLKDMGITEEDINQYLAGLKRKNGKIMVTGLSRLMGKAQPGPDGFTVDQSVLRDLLGRLGLSDSEVQTLMKQAVDSNGRSNPQAMLAALKVAAAKQDDALTQTLKELAGRMQINPVQQAATGDAAAQIKAQVQKALDQAGNSQQHAAELQELFKAIGAELEDQVAAPTAEEGLANNSQDTARQAMNLAARAQAQTQSASTSSSGSQTKQTSAQPSQNMQTNQVGQAAQNTQSAGSGQTGQAQRNLPVYVTRQVSEQMVKMVQQGQDTLRLNLRPAELGGIALKLTVKDGAVSATMITETAAAKGTLDAGAEQLRHLLSQHGLRLDRLEVMVGQSGQERTPQFGAQSGGSGAGSGGGEGRANAGDDGAGAGGQDGIETTGWGLTAADGDRISVFA